MYPESPEYEAGMRTARRQNSVRPRYNFASCKNAYTSVSSVHWKTSSLTSLLHPDDNIHLTLLYPSPSFLPFHVDFQLGLAMRTDPSTYFTVLWRCSCTHPIWVQASLNLNEFCCPTDLRNCSARKIHLCPTRNTVICLKHETTVFRRRRVIPIEIAVSIILWSERISYGRLVKIATLFDVLCGPTQLSNYRRRASPNAAILINFRFHLHVK
jgi:hypothetical protein